VTGSKAEGRAVVDAAMAADATGGATGIVRPGSPSAVLSELAESGRYDLLVVGSRGMAGARRLLGSVPDRVSHLARTSVLIVTGAE